MNRMGIYSTTALLAGILTACGSTSEENKNTSNGPGALVGPMFQGLQYKIGEQTGTLGSRGEFPHAPEENVEFFVGGIQLGSAKWAKNLTIESVWNTGLPISENELGTFLSNEGVEAIDILANQMLFLATLDNDDDATNGFNLAAWHGKLKTESINFEQPYYDFIKSDLSDFRERYELEETPKVHGLQGLYDATGQTLLRFLTEKHTYSDFYGNSGSISIWEYQYNDNGQVIEEVRKSDNAADNIIDRIATTTRTYDTNGNQVRRYYTEDRTMNGTPEVINEDLYAWDAKNNQTQWVDKDDRDGDGYWDRTQTTDTQYTVDNMRSRVVITTTQHNMFDVDTTSTKTTSYLYNDSGDLVVTRSSLDTDTDGATDRETIYTYKYDEFGNRILEETKTDSDYDGIVDQIHTTTIEYNSAGKTTLRLVESDFDGDGVLDYKYENQYVYDDEDQQIQQTTYRDTNNDGVLDWLMERTYTRDDKGHIATTLEQTDTNLDGEFDSIVMTINERTFNELGFLTQLVDKRDGDNDGTIEGKDTLNIIYNTDGFETKRTKEFDYGNDSTVDQLETTVSARDEYNNILERTSITDKFADGNYERETTSVYQYVSQPTDVATLFGVNTIRGDR